MDKITLKARVTDLFAEVIVERRVTTQGKYYSWDYYQLVYDVFADVLMRYKLKGLLDKEVINFDFFQDENAIAHYSVQSENEFIELVEDLL